MNHNAVESNTRGMFVQFLGKFEVMFNQMMYQNDMNINLLISLIMKTFTLKITALRVNFWNTNGLAFHLQEIEVYLSEEELDIVLLSETHFTGRNYFSIHEHKIYHNQHPDATAHEGTAIVISEKIQHSEMNNYEEDYLQATRIKIRDSIGSLTIAAIYCSPRHSVKETV